MPAPPSQGHTATLLSNNMVLLAGGLNGSTVLERRASLRRVVRARLHVATASARPASASNGVCCDTACTNQCGACNLAGSAGHLLSAKANSRRATTGTCCTQTDTCQAGTLRRRQPHDLPAQRRVPRAGHLRARDRPLLQPERAQRDTCTDGNACTQTDTCQTGTCTGGNPEDLHGVRPVPRRRHLRAGDRRLLEPERAPTERHATTGTLARRRTPAQAGACTGANPVTCAAADQCHVAGTCDPSTGQCSNPNARQRHDLQRQQPVHADRHLSGGRLHGRQPGDLHGVRPVPRRRDLRPATGVCSNPRQGKRRRPATTETRARRPTPVRPAPARAPTR